MEINQRTCQAELAKHNLIPRKYYGQVFTTDEKVIDELITAIKSAYKPGMKVVEIGGGLGYITKHLIEEFDDIDVVELDDELFSILNTKFAQKEVVKLNKFSVHSENMAKTKRKDDILNKNIIHNQHSEVQSTKSDEIPLIKKIIQREGLRLIHGDILAYEPPEQEYLLVGNIPFHIGGKLYRKFMSNEKNKPVGMVFITDKQYAKTLMGQPPRCYRVSLQAQSYGDIEIIADVPATSVYPEPKVMSCIMKITQNDTRLPKNFWKTVNHHWEHFPTKEVESPKAMGLKRWIGLCKSKKI